MTYLTKSCRSLNTCCTITQILGSESLNDRDPPDRDPLDRDPPPLDRDPLDRDAPPTETETFPCGQTDTCENITFINFVCGR